MRKFNYRFVLSNVGILLMIEALFMLFSALIGELYREEARQAIYLSAGITLLVGGLLTFADRVLAFAGVRQDERKRSITKREVFLTVTLAWIALALAGTLPYLLSGAIPSFTKRLLREHVRLHHHGQLHARQPGNFPQVAPLLAELHPMDRRYRDHHLRAVVHAHLQRRCLGPLLRR